MIIRKLVSLRQNPNIYPRKWYINFGYYEEDDTGRLRRTGDHEDCHFNEDELYEMVKPKLKAYHAMGGKE